jgi:hypothetical protein
METQNNYQGQEKHELNDIGIRKTWNKSHHHITKVKLNQGYQNLNLITWWTP